MVNVNFREICLIYGCDFCQRLITVIRYSGVFACRLNCVEKSENQLTFDKGSCRLVLAMRPLRIDMFLNDDPAVFLNAQGLLKFEHSRLKRYVCVL